MGQISCEDARKKLEAIKYVFDYSKKSILTYQETGDEATATAIKSLMTLTKQSIDELWEVLGRVTFEQAKEIFGYNFIGPEEIAKAWGLNEVVEQPIPFSRRELERANEHGFRLIFRGWDVNKVNFTLADVWARDELNRIERSMMHFSFTESMKAIEEEAIKRGWALIKEPQSQEGDSEALGVSLWDTFSDFESVWAEDPEREKLEHAFKNGAIDDPISHPRYMNLLEKSIPTVAEAVFDLLTIEMHADEVMNAEIWTRSFKKETGEFYYLHWSSDHGQVAVDTVLPKNGQIQLKQYLSIIK